jgi:ribosomal-protein-alanine N-acetyltransferase
MFSTLITERLILRKLETRDFQEIHNLRSNANVNRFIDRPKIANLEEAKEFIEKINAGITTGNWIYWAITLKTKDQLIGTICIWNISPDRIKPEIGFELLPEAQGKGLMQEALSNVIKFGFEEMNLAELEAFTHAENEKSINLLEKCGFQLTGTDENNANEKIYKLTNQLR